MKDNRLVSISTLYIVPTPIGNLKDITYRAVSTLKCVDLIVVEDIRRTILLLEFYSIKKRLFVLNSYNERQNINMLLEELFQGKNLALVSDAGTPVINDPGYCFIRLCISKNIRVVPLPGASAAVTALSASGLPSSRFCYEGFLPSKRNKRLNRLNVLKYEERTIIFYDTKYRLLYTLEDMVIVWGHDRYIVLARELTKFWESIHRAPVGELLTWIKENPKQCCGEFVLLVSGYTLEDTFEVKPEFLRTFFILRENLPYKSAVNLAAKIHGVKKRHLYNYCLDLRN